MLSNWFISTELLISEVLKKQAEVRHTHSWQYNFSCKSNKDLVLVREGFLPDHLKAAIERNSAMCELQLLILKYTLVVLASYYTRKL